MRRLYGMAFRLAIGGSDREPTPIDIRMQISTGLSIACGASCRAAGVSVDLPCRGGNLERTFVCVVVLQVQDVTEAVFMPRPLLAAPAWVHNRASTAGRSPESGL